MNFEEKHFRALPPPPGKCQRCAVEHGPDEPHDPTSLYYQFWFHGREGRWPTWEDALAHCAIELQEKWREALRQRGIDPASTSVRGG